MLEMPLTTLYWTLHIVSNSSSKRITYLSKKNSFLISSRIPMFETYSCSVFHMYRMFFWNQIQFKFKKLNNCKFYHYLKHRKCNKKYLWRRNGSKCRLQSCRIRFFLKIQLGTNQQNFIIKFFTTTTNSTYPNKCKERETW